MTIGIIDQMKDLETGNPNKMIAYLTTATTFTI